MLQEILHSDGPFRLRQRREHATTRHWAVAGKVVLGLALALACQSALAQAMYRIKPLGRLGGCNASAPVAFGFNAADQVTGQACNANGDLHAFLWSNNGKPMVDLGPGEVGSTSLGYAINASGLVGGSAQDSNGRFAFVSSGDGKPMRRIQDGLGGSFVAAYAINDLGQLTGEASTTGDADYHAFIWKNNGSPMIDLGTDGTDYSYGNAINASGQVAGTTGYSSEHFYEGFIWNNDGTPLLGLSVGTADLINKSGQVAGVNADTAYAHAYLRRTDGTIVDLGTLGGAASVPYALNDSGQEAGWSHTRQNLRRHAFVWLNNGTPMKDLGTLGGIQSAAHDMNSLGQATGWSNISGSSVLHAFLWRNDGTKMQDLNALVDPTDPLKPYVTLTSGEFINKLGDIAAEGTDSRTGSGGLYLLQGSVLTLSPRALSFGNQPIGATSAAKSVTMTNTSPKVVSIASIALTGSAASQFGSTNDCGGSLAGHATCTIRVTFKPTTKGAKSATLNVNGGGGGLRAVNLAGTGT